MFSLRSRDSGLQFGALKRLEDRSFRWTVNYNEFAKPAPFAKYRGFRWDVCVCATEDDSLKWGSCRWDCWLVLTASALQEPMRGISLPRQPFSVSIVDESNRPLWSVSTAISQEPVSPTVVAWKSFLSLRLPDMTVEKLRSSQKHYLKLEFASHTSNETEQAATSTLQADATEPQLKERGELLEAIRALQLDTEDADVTLHVSDKTYSAHKAILKARSPVFQRMFQIDMLESRSGVVEIPDCDPDAFGAYLQYVYSGDLDVVRADNVAGVLYVARKYGSEGLVRQCLGFMEKNLAVDRFCEFVAALLTDGQDSTSLEVTVEFFARHFSEIARSSQWSEFFQDNPVLANELMLKAHEKSLGTRK